MSADSSVLDDHLQPEPLQRLPGESGFEPPAKHEQFPLLDALRAIAAISILVIHTAILTDSIGEPGYGRFLGHLDIGVPFFFLLSAFLLYRPFVAARARGAPRGSFRTYARRRFVRIAPAYWAVLTISALVPGFAGIFSGNWWVYYGLLQNFPVYTRSQACVTEPFRCGMPLAWSLTVEVLFYAVLPLFVLAMGWLGRRSGKAGWLFVELIAVLAIGLISIAFQSHEIDSELRLWLFYSPLGRGWWFGLGLALASISVWSTERREPPGFIDWLRRHPWPPLIAAAGLYVFNCFALNSSLLAFPVTSQSIFVAQYVLVGVIGALVLLPAVFGQDGTDLPRRFLRHPALTWLGLVSYGIFLWQFPVLIGLVDLGVLDWWPSMQFPVLLVTGLAGTVACAAVSFYLLERPLIRRVRSRTRPAES